MSAKEQISRLEGLLERIRRNAALPRAVAAAAQPSPPEAAVTPDVLEEAPISEDVLLEDEIVDITVEGETPPGEEIGTEVDIDFEEESAEPPASSRRPRAVAQPEEEREVPIKTPPPESGRQVTNVPPMPLASLPADLLEADIQLRPTTEQLGQTIELDEPTGAQLELDEPLAPPVIVTPERAPEELEIPLPGRSPSGVYSEGLVPPPEAREELERHLLREAERSAPAHEIPVSPPVEAPPAPPEAVPAVIARPAIPSDARPSEFVVAAQSFSPATFADLLDASLALGSG